MIDIFVKAAMIGLVAWLFITVQDMTVQVGRLEVQVATLEGVGDRITLLESRIGYVERR